jgi:hypothetical protein
MTRDLMARGDAAPGRWWRRLLAAAAVAGLAGTALVASPAQAQVVTCTGSISNTTVSSTVLVPDGEACHLSNVMVLGDALVGSGSDLLMDQVVVGQVTAGKDAFVYGNALVAAQGIGLDHSFGAWLENSLVFGGADVQGSVGVLFLSEGTNYVGDVTSLGGWTLLRDGRVNGAVDSTRDQATTLVRMTVTGGVAVDTAVAGVLFCSLTSGGETSVHRSGGDIQIGGPFPTPRCAGNTFGGDLQVHDNQANDLQISANIVFGDVACTGNSPSPVGFGNIILGTASGQCSVLGTADGGGLLPPGNARGSAESTDEDEQHDAIVDPLRERRTAAETRLGA